MIPKHLMTPPIIGTYVRHTASGEDREVLDVDPKGLLLVGDPMKSEGWWLSSECEPMMTCGCGDVVKPRPSGQCDTCDAIDEM